MAETALRAILTGVAIGDGWGYPNENKSYKKLLIFCGWGPNVAVPQRLIVSDDTQLSLALAYALDGAAGQTPQVIQQWIIHNFLAWLHDPDMRGYGRTTITALRALDEGRPWFEATGIDSEKCGTVMRTAACAFLPDDLWAPVAAWQAASTHGGSSAIAAAVVATATLRKLIAGEEIPELLSCAIEICGDDDLAGAAAGWLADHPRAGTVESAADLMRTGMAEVRRALKRARDALPMFREDPWCEDVSDAKYGGEGWLARDALACALLCVDMVPGNPEEAIRRAVITGGDSDTIGAITGMFLGARYGDIWPVAWSDRIEPRYHDWILDAQSYQFS